MKKGFRIWKESKSTSPRGRFLALYKMWLLPDSPNEDVLNGYEFLQYVVDIINISKRLRLPLKRWKTVNNIYIPKETGNYKIHRQRPIHQIDAELNLVQRELITKRLLHNAEKYGVIPEYNHGGRNDMMANDVVMLKFITLGICHLQ